MSTASPGSNAALKGQANGSTSSSSSSTIAMEDLNRQSPFVNLRKQAKYLLVGAFGCWYWQVDLHLNDAWQGGTSSQLLAAISIALYAATTAVFAYIILLPATKRQVNYLEWQKDPRLSKTIPLLTACIVFGYVSLFFVLSPWCAPLPPSAALSKRLLEAANAAGGNLQKAKSGAQLLLADAAKSLGIGKAGGGGAGAAAGAAATGQSFSSFASASQSLRLDVDLKSLLRTFRLPNPEALAARLGVQKDHTSILVKTLDRYQARAQAWKENNVHFLGWTGAFLGSASAYALLLGVAGLVGLFTPRSRGGEKARRAML